MNLTDELREMMLARAEEAPSGTALLPGVRARSRRFEVRRRLAMVAVAALAVAAIAVGAPYALARRDRGPVGEPPTPTGLVLGPPGYDLPTFPFTPMWEPGQVRSFWAGLTDGVHTLVGYGDQGGVLLASVGPLPPVSRFPSGQSRQTAIGPHSAKLLTGTAEGRMFVELTWQLGDGRWVAVTSVNLLAVDEVEHFARELLPRPMLPTDPPITFAQVPIGYQLVSLSDVEICIAPGGTLAVPAESLCARWNDMSIGGGEPMVVGGLPGELVEMPGHVELRVEHRPGVTVTLVAPSELGLSTTDLVQIAGVVRVGPVPTP
jgi:hypothetical protein